MTWEYEGCTIIIDEKGKFKVKESVNSELKNLESVSLIALKAKIMKTIPKEETFIVYKGAIIDGSVKINNIYHYPLGNFNSRFYRQDQYILITKSHPLFIKLKNIIIEYNEKYKRHRTKIQKLDRDFNNNVKSIDINIE